MLQNAYLLAKIGADTAENEQHFAEMELEKEQAERRSAEAQVSTRSHDGVDWKNQISAKL